MALPPRHHGCPTKSRPICRCRSSSSRDGAAAASAPSPFARLASSSFFLDYVDDPVIQEYLDGPEFTIDVLCDRRPPDLDRASRARRHPRRRHRSRPHGSQPAAHRFGTGLLGGIEFHGAVNIQCRVVKGIPTVFEINPRFSGGIPLTIEAGADFPRMLVDLALGRRSPRASGSSRTDCG